MGEHDKDGGVEGAGNVWSVGDGITTLIEGMPWLGQTAGKLGGALGGAFGIPGFFLGGMEAQKAGEEGDGLGVAKGMSSMLLGGSAIAHTVAEAGVDMGAVSSGTAETIGAGVSWLGPITAALALAHHGVAANEEKGYLRDGEGHPESIMERSNQYGSRAGAQVADWMGGEGMVSETADFGATWLSAAANATGAGIYDLLAMTGLVPTADEAAGGPPLTECTQLPASPANDLTPEEIQECREEVIDCSP